MDSMSCQARVERRRENRFTAEIEATLNWDGVSQPVTIRNISMYGALLTGTWLPQIGEWVTLIAQGLEVCGTVIWDGPDRCGLLFNHPVDPLAIIAESQVHKVDHHPFAVQEVRSATFAGSALAME